MRGGGRTSKLRDQVRPALMEFLSSHIFLFYLSENHLEKRLCA